MIFKRHWTLKIAVSVGLIVFLLTHLDSAQTLNHLASAQPLVLGGALLFS